MHTHTHRHACMQDHAQTLLQAMYEQALTHTSPLARGYSSYLPSRSSFYLDGPLFTKNNVRACVCVFSLSCICHVCVHVLIMMCLCVLDVHVSAYVTQKHAC